jgi:hypothetical protein
MAPTPRTRTGAVPACGLFAFVFLGALASACSNDLEGLPGADGAGTGGASGSAGTGSGSGAGGASGASGGASSGGSGNGSGSGGSAGVPMAKPIHLAGAPIYTRFVRLTNDQWENSVKDVLRLSAAPGLAANFEQPVAGSTDFANNELVLTISSTLWGSYQSAAEAVAAQATGSQAALSALYSGTDRDGFVTTFGRRAFRRPLDADERARYGAVYDAGTAMTGTASAFAKGAALVIRAMLQSPHFLYRTELGADRAELTGFEAASKLSFWLRNTTPDDALLDAAAAGMLDTSEGLASMAARMLEEQGAAQMMQRFHAELFHFSRFRNIDKAGVPNYTTALNPELEQASTRFFDRIFTRNLGVREILTSTVGFVGPLLAPLYGLPAPAGGAMVEQELGERRTGFFAQVPFLMLYAINADPDSIHRGLSVNLDALCADPGLPEIQLPEIPPLGMGQTNRERIEGLTEGCGDCHEAIINPVGFAFEDFDGMGQLRATDNGEPVDTSGGYPFQEGFQQFDGSRELMQLMATGKQAHACYAKKISGYALQRDIVQADLPLLDALAATSAAPSASIKQVILDLVKNPAFRTRVGGPL